MGARRRGAGRRGRPREEAPSAARQGPAAHLSLVGRRPRWRPRRLRPESRQRLPARPRDVAGFREKGQVARARALHWRRRAGCARMFGQGMTWRPCPAMSECWCVGWLLSEGVPRRRADQAHRVRSNSGNAHNKHSPRKRPLHERLEAARYPCKRASQAMCLSNALLQRSPRASPAAVAASSCSPAKTCFGLLVEKKSENSTSPANPAAASAYAQRTTPRHSSAAPHEVNRY